MLQADLNTDLFNSFVLKAHNRECQNILFPLQILCSKSQLNLGVQIFIFSLLALLG